MIKENIVHSVIFSPSNINIPFKLPIYCKIILNIFILIRLIKLSNIQEEISLHCT